MNENQIELTPEQIEAMQQPEYKKTHPFIEELMNTNYTFQPQDLLKGVTYVLFIKKLELNKIEQLLEKYDQLILIFNDIKMLYQFMDSDLKNKDHVFYYFDDRDFNESFEFVIKQIRYTHCVITLYHEELLLAYDIDKEALSPSVVYHYSNNTVYPSFLIKNLNIHHRVNQFIKVYIDEISNHSIGISHMKIGETESDKRYHIQSIEDLTDALETINATYIETVSSNTTIQYKYEVNRLIKAIKDYINQLSSSQKVEVKEYIINNTNQFNYHLLNDGDAETLVIAYCFPPYIDTSGNVMAKRVRDKNEVVDIISNNMSRIRKKDTKLNALAEHLVDTHYLLEAKQAFSSWESISGFVEQGLEVLENNPKHYKNLYSRAMFPQSHFLAFDIKQAHPNIYWRAEFSDPLHSTVTSDLRYAPITDEEYINKVTGQLDDHLSSLVDDNVFNVCELLALSHADELIFTNEHQLEYMIARFDEGIKQSIRDRAVISRHPIPLKTDYKKVISNYQVSPDYINLGYFGNFYATRGFNEIELLCKYLESSGETQFRIHCFTNINSHVKRLYQNSDFKEYIILRPLVGYFEFLNITTLFDGLLLFDAHTIGIKPLNPYVPSKLSDYKGSGKMVWAFTEPGSIMDQDDSILKTHMTDFNNYSKGFNEIKKSVSRLSF
ncbi:hypothetical protein [Staphylococcus sp. 11261D007BR]